MFQFSPGKSNPENDTFETAFKEKFYQYDNHKLNSLKSEMRLNKRQTKPCKYATKCKYLPKDKCWFSHATVEKVKMTTNYRIEKTSNKEIPLSEEDEWNVLLRWASVESDNSSIKNRNPIDLNSESPMTNIMKDQMAPINMKNIDVNRFETSGITDTSAEESINQNKIPENEENEKMDLEDTAISNKSNIGSPSNSVNEKRTVNSNTKLHKNDVLGNGGPVPNGKNIQKNDPPSQADILKNLPKSKSK